MPRLITVFLFAIIFPIAGVKAQEQPFNVKQIAPHVWAAIATPTGGAGGNAGFVIGDDAVLVIDTVMSTAAAQELLGEIRKVTKLPIRYVVNTHYHFDHVVGNRVFVDAGAVVLAQQNVRGWIVPENLRLLGKDAKPELKGTIEGVALPTILYERGVDVYLGSRRIRVESLPGHTGGDSIVIVPDARTVFMGDLFWRNILPNLIDASTAAWIETLGSVAAAEPNSSFVPGHGDVGTAKDLLALRDYLATLRTFVSEARAKGLSGSALVDSVMPALTARYGEWDFFKYLAQPSILHMDEELSGTKRIPRAEAAVGDR